MQATRRGFLSGLFAATLLPFLPKKSPAAITLPFKHLPAANFIGTGRLLGSWGPWTIRLTGRVSKYWDDWVGQEVHIADTAGTKLVFYYQEHLYAAHELMVGGYRTILSPAWVQLFQRLSVQPYTLETIERFYRNDSGFKNMLMLLAGRANVEKPLRHWPDAVVADFISDPIWGYLLASLAACNHPDTLSASRGPSRHSY